MRFHRYWRETHGPIAAKIPQLHRYVQSHRIPAFGSNSPYDGEAEVLVDGLDAMRRCAAAQNTWMGRSPTSATSLT